MAVDSHWLTFSHSVIVLPNENESIDLFLDEDKSNCNCHSINKHARVEDIQDKDALLEEEEEDKEGDNQDVGESTEEDVKYYSHIFTRTCSPFASILEIVIRGGDMKK